MGTHIRYRQSEKGLEFCCWDIQRQQFEDCRVYFINIHEGHLGDLNNANVEIDPNPFELKKIEREIMEAYPIETLPLKEHEISIELKNGDWKPEKIKELERKLVRSIEWNFIHTGLGFKEPSYHWVANTFVLSVKLIPSPKIKALLEEDFSHWIPCASIKVLELSY